MLKLYDKITNKNLLIKRINITANNVISEDLIQEKISTPVNQYKFIPPIEQKTKSETTYSNSFDLSSFIPKQNELALLTTNITMSNNNIPLIKEESKSTVLKTTVLEERDTYTLNDYRIFNKMLKDIKEHNDGSVISIDKNLEYRLITKYSTEKYNMFKKMLKIYSN